MGEIEVLHTIKHVLNTDIMRVIQCRDDAEARVLEQMFRELLYDAPLYVTCIDDVLIIEKM